MNRDEIMAILPHRDAMLLVDEAQMRDGKAYGTYRVRGDEWFLRGHFPGNPVVPGVILCEMLAQSACVLLSDKESAGLTPYLTGIDGVRLKKPVRPGDVFETECEITKAKPPFYFARGVGRTGGEVCVKAEFSFALVRDGK
ncbi:MAG: beta-hydroxyacyl-ACP dehydratase [Clostridiales bacterium]|nr:beta-hydroxyacyl-ACP dehydratase [Clostridiales bacterium]